MVLTLGELSGGRKHSPQYQGAESPVINARGGTCRAERETKVWVLGAVEEQEAVMVGEKLKLFQRSRWGRRAA